MGGKFVQFVVMYLQHAKNNHKFECTEQKSLLFLKPICISSLLKDIRAINFNHDINDCHYSAAWIWDTSRKWTVEHRSMQHL
ncbi:hypothetical protein chiPu_0014667 [Chiloscyllium punctatum]|uniref:Uncharacterized protein n=1 Tax=Chiloscyllium punctatum TaxID=137246 RepID=A0A401T0M4_CHIPU|nr:hypothetical protein [Chiloscyllium punctatum]